MQKDNITTLKTHALGKGGLCLSDKYINSKTKMLWQCKEGHQWEAIWYSIKIGKWCSHCAGIAKPDIKELHNHAKSRKGKLLSATYVNNRVPLKWQCSEGHQWEATWNAVKDRNSWCPHCTRQAKPDISILQQHAISKGGLLLSTEYINNSSKLLWQCEKGHVWKACWGNMKSQNRWCPHCAKTAKPDIKELQEHAKSKGGLLISTEYKNSATKMLWQCKEGHQWRATWNNIKCGKSWCAACDGQTKPDISILQQYAISKGGLLLSTEYKNSLTKMLWECKKGHQWEACWGSMKSQDGWCPECSSLKTELMCKQIFESELKIPFKKTRFKYENKRYEFDGYNEEHKIAFEYHGKQHYEFPNYWQKTLEEHEKAKQRDLKKIEYCNLNNIKLYVVSFIHDSNLLQYIKGIIHDTE